MRPVILVALTILFLTSACERPASTAQPFTGQNPFTPEAAAHLCTAAELQTSSNAHDESGFVILGITLINQSQHACNLQPPPQVSLRSAGQILDVERIQATTDETTLRIAPGESLILVMGWRNYCGKTLKDHPEIDLALTESETLTVQTELTAFPPCENANAPSTLTINPYSYPP
jgi:hypothetical protein